MSIDSDPPYHFRYGVCPGLSPAKFKCWLNLTRIWIKMLNQVAIVAFYSCFEEQKGQFGILVLVCKAYNSLECRLIKPSAGYCDQHRLLRPAPTSVVITPSVPPYWHSCISLLWETLMNRLTCMHAISSFLIESINGLMIGLSLSGRDFKETSACSQTSLSSVVMSSTILYLVSIF